MERLHLWASALVALCFYFEVESSPTRFTGEGKTYCGEKLVQALDIVCSGIFNEMIKRHAFKDDLNDDSSQVRYWTSPNDKTSFPFQPKHIAQVLLPTRRRRRGIVDECCRQACTINEMRAYCGDDN